ncbi:MAG: hypothetical protein BGO25_12990 [Acidobacteriales bacterium 59-55]|nr:MAG: hypothetical protein BGO25_12990 [Acidobacteriales bacterium 59-55]
MLSHLLLLFVFAVSGGFAVPGASTAAKASVVIWTGGVPPQGITHKDDFGSHILSISHREKSGRVEMHETKADVLVIQSGEATLVYGGQVIDPKLDRPHEIQGSSIQGGTTRQVKAGDVIHIPIGVPHQFLLAPGSQITYLVVKIVDSENRSAK